jgi:uncharacterized lipoprotein YddW (UPF0748 family)
MTLQGCHLKEGALKVYSGQGAERTAFCPAQGIEAESPDDDRREEEDLERKARPPRRAGGAPECADGNFAFYCFKCVGPVFITLLLLLFAGKSFSIELNYPKQEIRAVWLTTIYGLDWPAKPACNETECLRQQRELCVILDRLKDANFNTVFVQARLRGDVIYASAIEPASKVFSGKYGVLPGYDPLEYVIEECHKRSMECHAFFVTFPIGSDRIVNEQGSNSVVRRKPYLCLKHRDQWYLDPGMPGTVDYILSLVKEIICNYDIDGIQFDYMRYPENARNFPDKQSYAKYGKGKKIADWRRENINCLISEIHDWVKQEKPWVQVSSCPLGKYSKIAACPNVGWTAYDDVFQDTKAWLQDGKQDMIVPMMYYRQHDFYPFVDNWMEHASQRSMVAGLGAYRLNKKEGDWNLSEIKEQINYIRQHGVAGCAFFRTQFVVDDEKGIYTELKNNFFKYPAQLPPLTWMNDSVQPKSPEAVRIVRERDTLKLSWEEEETDRYTYTVYYSLTDTIDTGKAESILATGLRKNEMYVPVDTCGEKGYTFSVSASNRYRIESNISHETYYYLSEYEK